MISEMGTYNRLNQAMTAVARRHKVHPTDIRVLASVAAAGGKASHHDVRDEGICATQVRRSSMVLRRMGAVEAHSPMGGPAKRGLVTVLSLTDHGWRIAAEVDEEARK
jgi:hypothetical protein